MPGAPSAVRLGLATAGRSAARVGSLEKAAQLDVDQKKNEKKKKKEYDVCEQQQPHAVFQASFFGKCHQKKQNKTAHLFFKLPICWMSADGNAEEQHLHPRQHLCRKQLLATHD